MTPNPPDLDEVDPDGDAMAAEWEAMLGGADKATRVLSQDEIDSLLGFDDEPEPPQPPRAWNDWRRQWGWIKRISMGCTLKPFDWELDAQAPKMHGNMHVTVGPIRVRLFWPWCEQWD